MDHPSRGRRWGARSILLAVLVVALLATLALAPAQAQARVDATLRALSGWLWPTRWAWPLATALTLAALTTPLARRRWPRPVHRIPAAIVMFAGLVGLASLATVRQPRMGLLTLGAVMAVGLLAAWVLVVPRRLAPPVPAETLESLEDRDRLEVTDARVKLQNDLRTTALQAIAGLAVLAGAVLGFQQLTEDRQQATASRELTVQGQASERFTRAIDQLGSDRREVQLGGIYGLEQIAQQAPANRLAVTEVLVAYLHRRIPRSTKRASDTSPVEELRIRAPDAQAALTVLGRRHIAPTDPPLNLRALDLRRADLSDVDLSDADLIDVDLHRAILLRADLSGAFLDTADLRSTILSGADLRGAFLAGADLRRATLIPANLSGANLEDANLRDAILRSADLRDAILRGADLRGADLNAADLSSADLSGALLDGAYLRGATADQSTTWPEGFDRQGAGVRQEQSSTRP